jgi:photosystem II stability/assembly factor-like uncharacterized protein
MQSLKISLLVFILTNTISAQWYEKLNGLPDTCYAYAIDAIDSLIATGPFSITPNHIPDSIYLTTNGGDIWYSKPLPSSLVSYDYIYDISIKDENKIWFCTGEGKIYHTTDSGFTWQLQFYDTSMTEFMNYIEMFDSLNGMAMGDAPANDKPALFLKTTNGGTNWISQNQLFFLGEYNYSIWRTVDFVDINTGYFFPSNGPLYKTINGGSFWQAITSNQQMLVLKVFNANILLGVDQYIIYRTTDGGLSWESNQSNLLEFGYDIEFVPEAPSKVWYASSAVCYSSDMGRTWQEEFSLSNYGFWDIIFTDENSGWLIAGPDNAKLFRTTNGGFGGIVSVEEKGGNVNVVKYKLSQNYPNPFNPTTSLQYTISSRQFVTLKVYDLLGREVARLVNEEKPAGTYEVIFDSHSGEVRNLPSGIYFYQLKAGSFTQTKKMILMK